MMLMGKGGLCGFETPGLHEGVHRLEEACEPSEAVYFDTSLSGVRKLADRLLKLNLYSCVDWAGTVPAVWLAWEWSGGHFHMRSVVSTVLRIPAQTRQ